MRCMHAIWHARDGGPVHVGGRVARRGSFASCRWSPHMHEEQVADAGYAYNAHPDLTTICRSFPKISSALSTKFCGGSRSTHPWRHSRSGGTREMGGLSMRGEGSAFLPSG